MTCTHLLAVDADTAVAALGLAADWLDTHTPTWCLGYTLHTTHPLTGSAPISTRTHPEQALRILARVHADQPASHDGTWTPGAGYYDLEAGTSHTAPLTDALSIADHAVDTWLVPVTFTH